MKGLLSISPWWALGALIASAVGAWAALNIFPPYSSMIVGWPLMFIWWTLGVRYTIRNAPNKRERDIGLVIIFTSIPVVLWFTRWLYA